MNHPLRVPLFLTIRQILTILWRESFFFCKRISSYSFRLIIFKFYMGHSLRVPHKVKSFLDDSSIFDDLMTILWRKKCFFCKRISSYSFQQILLTFYMNHPLGVPHKNNSFLGDSSKFDDFMTRNVFSLQTYLLLHFSADSFQILHESSLSGLT